MCDFRGLFSYFDIQISFNEIEFFLDIWLCNFFLLLYSWLNKYIFFSKCIKDFVSYNLNLYNLIALLISYNFLRNIKGGFVRHLFLIWCCKESSHIRTLYEINPSALLEISDTYIVLWGLPLWGLRNSWRELCKNFLKLLPGFHYRGSHYRNFWLTYLQVGGGFCVSGTVGVHILTPKSPTCTCISQKLR